MFNQDAAVLGFAVLFIRLNSLFDPINATNQIEAGALRGVGDSRTPMIIMLMSFVVLRQIYLFIVSRLTDSIYFIAIGYPVGWIICTALMTLHIKRIGWEKKIASLQ
jgi:Na+-driven multidrug efflux pump